jgi:hypothetical protein
LNQLCSVRAKTKAFGKPSLGNAALAGLAEMMPLRVLKGDMDISTIREKNRPFKDVI